MTEAYSTHPHIEQKIEQKADLCRVEAWMKKNHPLSKVAQEAVGFIQATENGLDISGWKPITAPKSVVFKCIKEAIHHTAPELEP